MSQSQSQEILIAERVSHTTSLEMYSTEPSKDPLTATDEISMTSFRGSKEIKRKTIDWYYAPAFLLFWLALFFAIVIPVYYHLPEGHRINSTAENSCTFIAERAENILFGFERIGERTVGTYLNENVTKQYVLDEIDKVKEVMDHTQFEMEVDVQVASGAYIHWHMINQYQGVQNVVVKLTPKGTTSQSYFLINSHYDSKPGAPGTGDAAAMIVVMLEVLRVLASAKCPPMVHPIVFLFNGAEENPLQTSHSFITQHKWAKNCKALINLDSAGSGHREILFQSGPNHPWLMNYYRKVVKRPFATTMAEEVFETGLVPSDTDFRIFKNFGKVPGLDLVHAYNGYVYHTEFDKIDVIPHGTIQITGDHILALAHAFANAPEMEDTSKYENGHPVFYDFLGLFFVYYTENVAKVINTIVSLAAIIVPGISLWRMSVENIIDIKKILKLFGLVFLLHFAGFLLAFGLPLLMAVFYDWDDRTMTMFSHKWLVIGQFICPSIVGLALPTLLYFSLKKKQILPMTLLVQLALHAHAVLLALICIIITFVGIRTSYLLMVSMFFYVCTLIINLVSKLHGRGFFWMILHIVGQIMPFLYFTYLFHAMLSIVLPMTARIGSHLNPDIFIALLCSLGTVLSMGFITPTLSIFRRPKSILGSLLIVTFIFAMISVSDVGFPYRPKTNVGRMNFLLVRRVFYGYDGSVERNESGFYFDPQDRRKELSIKDYVDVSKIQSIRNDCDEQMMCGVPTFNHRWYKARKSGLWLPSEQPLEVPYVPKLQVVNRTVDPSTSTVHYDFNLSEIPPHFGIFVKPIKDAKISSWSFLPEMLEREPEYHVFFSYGIDNSPIDFNIDIRKPGGEYDVPLFELGIAGHFLDYKFSRGAHGEAFIKSFPNYVHCMQWPSSYERYIF